VGQGFAHVGIHIWFSSWHHRAVLRAEEEQAELQQLKLLVALTVRVLALNRTLKGTPMTRVQLVFVRVGEP